MRQQFVAQHEQIQSMRRSQRFNFTSIMIFYNSICLSIVNLKLKRVEHITNVSNLKCNYLLNYIDPSPETY